MQIYEYEALSNFSCKNKEYWHYKYDTSEIKSGSFYMCRSKFLPFSKPLGLGNWYLNFDTLDAVYMLFFGRMHTGERCPDVKLILIPFDVVQTTILSIMAFQARSKFKNKF